MMQLESMEEVQKVLLQYDEEKWGKPAITVGKENRNSQLNIIEFKDNCFEVSYNEMQLEEKTSASLYETNSVCNSARYCK